MLPGQLLTGIGVGLILPSLSGVVGTVLPAARWGAGSSMVNTMRQIGTVLGTAVLVAVFAGTPDLADFRRGWLLVLVTAVATSAGGLLIAARRRTDHYVEPQALSSAASPSSMLSNGNRAVARGPARGAGKPPHRSESVWTATPAAAARAAIGSRSSSREGAQVQPRRRRHQPQAAGEDPVQQSSVIRSWRSAYTWVARRMWRANRPSSTNRASAACAGRSPCQSDELAGVAQRVPQRRRGDQETQAQHGKQRLRERPDVGHAAAAVQALQRLQRPVGEPELAVVVVLDDDRVRALGPRQQRRAPGQGHRRAERELVRRRDVHQLRPRGQRGDVEAFAVHRHADDLGAVRREEQLRQPVAGLLDGDPVARLEQHAAQQVERLLRALGDEHVVGAGAHRAGDADVPGDRRAQARVPARVGVVREPGGVPQLPREQPPPGFEGEQRGVGDADAEVVLRRPRDRGDRRRQRPPDRLGLRTLRRRSLTRFRRRQHDG